MRKILVVEDSPLQLKSLEITLSRLGHEVLTATNAVDGIDMAYQNFPDLIISDIVMPEVNGYQLCRLLKNDDLLKKIPIILLTRLDEKLDSFWGLKAGADSYIVKSNNSEELLNTVSGFLNNSPEITEDERYRLIKEKTLENKSIQTRIVELLDQSLIESTITNEFRILSEFIYATKVLSKEIFSLVSSLVDYNVAVLFFNDRDDKKNKMLNLGIQNVILEDAVFDEIKQDFLIKTIGSEYYAEESSYEYEIIETNNDKNKEGLEVVEQINVFKSKLVIPIVYANKTVGGIALYHKKSARFEPSRVIDIILQELKMLMRIKWLYSETKYLAITDGLTGLYNRRYFQQTLDREFARSYRYKSNLSIALFDIDNFKSVNDTYGHQVGDRVIIEVSKIIKNALRKTDYVARYGGEEIVVILTETRLENTLIPIERIRTKIQNNEIIQNGHKVSVTVSCGLAEIGPEVSTHDELLLRADNALYESKKTGKNKTTVYKQ